MAGYSMVALPGPRALSHCTLCGQVARRRIVALAKVDTSEGQLPPAPPAPKSFLYESKFGLPVVRETLNYTELLKAIRQGKVRSVHWFKAEHKGTAIVDGPCLVEYIDGSLKQSNVPIEEVRIRYAMETHGVVSQGLPTMPTPNELKPYQGFPLQSVVELAIKYLPFLGFFLIWAAVQFKDLLKGDFTDRSQVRKKEREDAAFATQQQREDDKILGLQKMVVNNSDEDSVRKEITRLNLDISEEELQAMLTDARRMKAREETGTWELAAEEEENVRKRQAQLAGESTGEEDITKLGLRMRKARLRSVNRTRLRGKLKNVEDAEVFFSDVAGIDVAKQELSEIVDFFNFPERYGKSGARSPRGCLLYGPPGTGKTLLARAVAGEANAAFLGINASEFVEMFIGVGAARVRDLFATARENAPAVVFIDEIDAVGRVRGGSMGSDEREQTLNQMLSEMDGFDTRTGVVVIAATNRRDILDPALVRPGRFDRQVYVGPPSRDGRAEVLQVHLKKFPWDPETVDVHDLAAATDSYTGAMLANLCNVAALMANRAGRTQITKEDFRVALQYEQQGLPAGHYGPQLTKRIAIVEGATAVAATLMPAIEPVEWVYTQPTEKRKTGQTVLQDNEQRTMTELSTKQYLQEQIRVDLAGRAAERLLLGEDEISSLNMHSINHARSMVHMLVLSSAMSDNPAIGPQMMAQPYRDSETSEEMDMFLGAGTALETATIAQVEMEQMLHQAEQEMYDLLEKNKDVLVRVVDKLCSEPYELSGDEVRQLVATYGDGMTLEQMEKDAAAFL